MLENSNRRHNYLHTNILHIVRDIRYIGMLAAILEYDFTV